MFTFFIQISPSLSLGLPGNQLAGASTGRQRERENEIQHMPTAIGKENNNNHKRTKWNHSKIQPKKVPVPIVRGMGVKDHDFFFFFFSSFSFLSFFFPPCSYNSPFLLSTTASHLSLRMQAACVDARRQESCFNLFSEYLSTCISHFFPRW